MALCGGKLAQCVPPLAHQNLNAPVAGLWLFIWRGNQGLPFATAHGPYKLRGEPWFAQHIPHHFGAFDR